MAHARIATPRLRELARRAPAIAILGPRQAGKTTLAKLAFPDYAYVDLEDPRDAARFDADPLFFLREHPRLVIDEAQRSPALFPVLRAHLDQRPRSRVVLLGSASPYLVRSVSESLAGRVLFFELGGISCFEEDIARIWPRGGFPRLHWARPRAKPEEWYPSYLRATLERDVPQLGLALPAARGRSLLTLIAAGQGGVLNLSELGGPLGVSYHTVSAAIDVLEGVFLVRRLRPYAANIRKRLVKSPKLYVRDTGLLHALLGAGSTRAELLRHPKAGASWETFCIEQIILHAAMVDPRSEAFFLRTQTGVEVDLLLRLRGELIAFEIKLGLAISDVRPMRVVSEDLGVKRGFQVNASDELVSVGRGIWAGGLVPVLEELALRP